MRYYILLLLLTTAQCVPLKAQSYAGSVEYDLTTNMKGIPLPRTATLTFDRQNSHFFYDRGLGGVMVDKDGNVGDISMTVRTTAADNGKASFDYYHRDEWGNNFLVDLQNNTLAVREFAILIPVRYREESLPLIDWKLRDSTKLIGNTVCALATTTFRGRTYEAWFAPGIPVSFGPWKLHGLPGLILEAYDRRREISFVAKTLNVGTDLTVVVPSGLLDEWDGRDISFAEARTIHKDTQRKMAARVNSAKPRGERGGDLPHLPVMEIYPEQGRKE